MPARSSRAHPVQAPPVPTTPIQSLELAAGLIDVRDLVRTSAAAASLPAGQAAGFVLAVHEVAMNAVTHGQGQGAVRIWDAGDGLVCEVEDHGPGMTDPRAGLVPPDPGSVRGRGLWIARQLCELVEIETSAAGTLVRLHTRLGRDA